jgi:aryl-alcohol dehydrogenase-like predicted oxidoreductase
VEHRALGNSGLQVSAIGLGSWLTLGSSLGRAQSVKLVHRAFELGINFFDTADVYSEGQTEEALGFAVADLPRHRLVLATKAYFPMSDDPNDRGLSRNHLFDSVEGSLRRLRTDYLDLHQCHRFDSEVPLEETVRAYEDLIRSGKVRHWGVSAWSAEQIGAAVDVARRSGAFAPISNQPEYSLLKRDIEGDFLDSCADLGVGQVIWGALAQGALTGKYRGGVRPEGSRGADDFRAQFMEPFLKEDVLNRVEALGNAARDHGISTAQLAIAWCLRDARIASVIVGATRVSQLEDNVGAAAVEVSETLAEALDRAFAPH